MEVDISVTASVQKHIKEPFNCFKVPLNYEGQGDDYVYPEEITIKEEKEDKDNEENLVTLEIKLENEEIPEIKEPELVSCHPNSSNTNDPEEILPTNDYYRVIKPILDTDTKSYVAKDCKDTFPQYDFCGNGQIEAHLQSQTKAPEHSENSISCFENAENILPTISEENAEEILPTVDAFKDNLLQPTTLQPSKFKQKYKCSECYASYQSLSRYRSHKKHHRNVEAQKSIKRYKNTMKRLTNVRGFPHFKCDQCDQKYIYVTSLEKHMLNCHAPFPVKLVKGSEILNNAENSNIGTVNWNENDNSEKVLPTNDFSHQSENNTLTYSETTELEGIMNNILKLQQCSVDASRDMLNEIEKKYECPNCRQSYKNSTTYRQHLHKHIKDEKLLLARRKSQISRRHAKANRGFTHFKCEKCNKKYSLLASLKKHMKNCLIEVKEEPHDYICTCKKIFSTESDMLVCFRRHEAKPANVNADNSDDNDTVKWPLTDSYISLLKDDSTAEVLLNNIKLLEKDVNILNSKMATISESPRELYECPKCFMSYSISRSYRTHINRHLSQTNRALKKTKMIIRMKLLKARNVYADFICDVCKYISTDSKDLENHRITCQIGENLETSVNTSHQSDMNTSTEPVSLQTQDSEQSNLQNSPSNNACTSSSRSHSLENTDNLSDLVQVTNDLNSKEICKGGETQRIHRCPKCSLFYINFAEFQQHLSKHNEEEMRILPKKMRVKTMRLFKQSTNFKCEKCNKIYVYEESLNRHMRQCQKPTGSEKFEINVYPCACGKTFSRKTRMESCLLSHSTKSSDTSPSVLEYNINTADGVKEILSTSGVCTTEGSLDLSTDKYKTSIQQEQTSNANGMSNRMSLFQTQTLSECEHLEGDEPEQDEETGTIAVKRVKDVRGLMLYKCNQCDRTYMHKGSLESHVNSQHKTEDMIPIVSEEYPCTCGKVFVRKSRMETCLKKSQLQRAGQVALLLNLQLLL
ncbi:Zinc finger protein 629 [Eumeta japonica]|uniref:Zinc finger protein 629 n=1 Tax=Eumeta variegata TaxID=151549 RepID=A0A4C1UJD5_EUMVA|nr:Zinc finger protein 629 [Eumeta japonica]